MVSVYELWGDTNIWSIARNIYSKPGGNVVCPGEKGSQSPSNTDVATDVANASSRPFLECLQPFLHSFNVHLSNVCQRLPGVALDTWDASVNQKGAGALKTSALLKLPTQ